MQEFSLQTVRRVKPGSANDAEKQRLSVAVHANLKCLNCSWINHCSSKVQHFTLLTFRVCLTRLNWLI